jgi:hypothetical protein
MTPFTPTASPVFPYRFASQEAADAYFAACDKAGLLLDPYDHGALVPRIRARGGFVKGGAVKFVSNPAYENAHCELRFEPASFSSTSPNEWNAKLFGRAKAVAS